MCRSADTKLPGRFLLGYRPGGTPRLAGECQPPTHRLCDVNEHPFIYIETIWMHLFGNVRRTNVQIHISRQEPLAPKQKMCVKTKEEGAFCVFLTKKMWLLGVCTVRKRPGQQREPADLHWIWQYRSETLSEIRGEAAFSEIGNFKDLNKINGFLIILQLIY